MTSNARERKMSIHEFHSKLTSDDEGNELLAALRSLRSLQDPGAMISDETARWSEWSDPIEPGLAPLLAGSPA
jgi:hypothetical protein